MTANEFIKKTRSYGLLGRASFYFEELRPNVICADGYSVSMQVGDGLYSTPGFYGMGYYSEVELRFPNMEDELINDYAEDSEDYTQAVYPYVPVELVDALFKKHGGIANEF